MPVSFEVDPTKKHQPPKNKPANHGTGDDSIRAYARNLTGLYIKDTNIIRHSRSSENYVRTPFQFNGFVGTCLLAYNEHYHLELSPDAVWITIMTSLSRYVNAHAEALRSVFVAHEGQLNLEAQGTGSLYTANYDDLVDQLVAKIDENTHGSVRQWAEVGFSTTSRIDSVASKIVLMGAMQKYFTYTMSLKCGLPGVTLTGTIGDWESIIVRIGAIGKIDKTLRKWAEVLEFVMLNFVAAFHNNVNKDFWNRIAHITGGGSGPRYLEGWICALIGFSDDGEYLLDDIKDIGATNKFCRINTNKIPSSITQVPVNINDNGTLYKATFYAGAMLAAINGTTLKPAIDWIAIETPSDKDEPTKAD